jgi:hypothetical protein
MDWKTFIVSILGAALTGSIASLLTPWSRWGVEKSRLKTKRRQRLVDSWYTLAEDYQNNDIDIIDHKYYVSLRQFLSDEAIKEFEITKFGVPITIIAGHQGVTADQQAEVLLAEIKRIESDWKLI